MNEENEIKNDTIDDMVRDMDGDVGDVIQKGIDESPQTDGVNPKNTYVISKKTLAVIICCCLLLSTVFGFGGALAATSLANSSSLSETINAMLPDRATAEYSKTGFNLEAATGSEMTIQEIISTAADAVVEIRTESVTTDIWMGQYVTEGAGSGVIIKSDGYIMTNNHVIENASKITVTLKDGTTHEAELIGTDTLTDVAVVKIEASGLTAAVFGNSKDLVVGDLTVAIGNPLGELGGTATAGIVSALDRELTIDGKSMSLLQTDASINPGNSGGGLFNQYGQLIGLVVAKSSGSGVEGLGFAIPINTASQVASEIMENGYVTGRAAMGLTLLDLSDAMDAARYNVSRTGVYVVSADTNNAKSAGFQSGDLLYAIDDNVITSYSDVVTALQNYSVGDDVKVTVVRENKTQVLALELGERKN